MNLDIRSDRPGTWSFPIEPTAETVSEFREEFPQLMSRLFDCLSPLYIPQALSWAGSLFESDIALDEAAGNQTKSVAPIRGELNEPTGIIPSQLASKFICEIEDYDEIAFIDIVDVENGIVTISGNGWQSVSNVAAPEFERDNVIVDPEAATNRVLSVFIDCRATIETGYDTEFYTTITTDSGLWFDDTERARKNRDNLRKVLRSIALEFGVEYVHTSTDLYKLEDCELTENDILP